MTNQKTFGPYSPIFKAGNMYYVSGQVGFDVEAKTVSSDVKDQTKQALNNLQDILRTKNLKLKDVVKVTVFLVDIDDFVDVNAVYEKYFTNPKPARSMVAIKDLPRVIANQKLLVEIEVVAYRGGRQNE